METELQLQRQLPKQHGNTGCLVEPKSQHWGRRNSTCEPTQQVLGIPVLLECAHSGGGREAGPGHLSLLPLHSIDNQQAQENKSNSKPEACFLLDASVFPSLSKSKHHDSEVLITGCSCRGPEFGPQHPYQQLPITCL